MTYQPDIATILRDTADQFQQLADLNAHNAATSDARDKAYPERGHDIDAAIRHARSAAYQEAADCFAWTARTAA